MTAQLLETPAAEGAGVAWELDELDARATLDAARRSVRVRRAAEVEEMRLTAHWAVLHGEPRDERDPMTQLRRGRYAEGPRVLPGRAGDGPRDPHRDGARTGGRLA